MKLIGSIAHLVNKFGTRISGIDIDVTTFISVESGRSHRRREILFSNSMKNYSKIYFNFSRISVRQGYFIVVIGL